MKFLLTALRKLLRNQTTWVHKKNKLRKISETSGAMIFGEQLIKQIHVSLRKISGINNITTEPQTLSFVILSKYHTSSK